VVRGGVIETSGIESKNEPPVLGEDWLVMWGCGVLYYGDRCQCPDMIRAVGCCWVGLGQLAAGCGWLGPGREWRGECRACMVKGKGWRSVLVQRGRRGWNGWSRSRSRQSLE
jgi:hypothetical protein